jgi:GR25 family glycosyltransferase involved in LPS biosynthesis
MSHYSILCHAEENKYNRTLILEDDAIFCENFTKIVTDFLDRVPDYDGLWLGGHHTINSIPVSENIVKCNHTIRMHCYAVTQKYTSFLIKEIKKYCLSAPVDVITANTHKEKLCFSPNPFLIGQAAGRSTTDSLVRTDNW